jgi:hypothetical protein
MHGIILQATWFTKSGPEKAAIADPLLNELGSISISDPLISGESLMLANILLAVGELKNSRQTVALPGGLGQQNCQPYIIEQKEKIRGIVKRLRAETVANFEELPDALEQLKNIFQGLYNEIVDISLIPPPPAPTKPLKTIQQPFILYKATHGELCVKFSNRHDMQKFFIALGSQAQIPAQHVDPVNNPQFVRNPQGLTPCFYKKIVDGRGRRVSQVPEVLYTAIASPSIAPPLAIAQSYAASASQNRFDPDMDNLRLFFPSYTRAVNKPFSVNFVTQARRDTFIKLLKIREVFSETGVAFNNGYQTTHRYGNLASGGYFFTTYDGKMQDGTDQSSAIYFNSQNDIFSNPRAFLKIYPDGTVEHHELPSLPELYAAQSGGSASASSASRSIADMYAMGAAAFSWRVASADSSYAAASRGAASSAGYENLEFQCGRDDEEDFEESRSASNAAQCLYAPPAAAYASSAAASGSSSGGSAVANFSAPPSLASLYVPGKCCPKENCRASIRKTNFFEYKEFSCMRCGLAFDESERAFYESKQFDQVCPQCQRTDFIRETFMYELGKYKCTACDHRFG